MEEESSELNKPGYRPKFLSEYSMGQFDFERYNQWLKYIEHWSSEINSVYMPTLDMIQHLYSGLNILYDSWRPLISVKEITEEIDKAFEFAKEKKRIWERGIHSGIIPSDNFVHILTDKLMDIKRRLMGMKQILGLGILVKRNLDTKAKIKAGMGRGERAGGMPEV